MCVSFWAVLLPTHMLREAQPSNAARRLPRLLLLLLCGGARSQLLSAAAVQPLLADVRRLGGYVNPRVRLTNASEPSGWGWHASVAEDLGADELVFSVPDEFLLTPSMWPRSRPPDYKLDESERLGLVLLQERRLGAESLWRHYLALLPGSFDTPYYFTDDELGALGGFARRLFSRDALSHARRLRSMGAAARAAGLRAAPSEMEWALSVVRSRAFLVRNTEGHRLDGTPFLAPVVDLLNHAPAAASRVAWSLGVRARAAHVAQ